MTASPRLRIYSPDMPGKPTLLSMGSPQTRMSGYQRTSDFDLGTDAQGFARPVGLDSIHYEIEQGGNYSQSPAYMLPNGPSGMVDYGTSSWSPKTWEPVLNANRSTNGGIYSDTDTNGSINQPHYSYMMPTQGISPNEAPQTTTAVMPMVPLPDIPGPDRILPTPTSRTQQIPGNAAAMNLFTDGIPGLSVPSDFKTSYWNQRFADQRAHTVPSNAPFATTSTSTSPKCNNSNSSHNNSAPEIIFSFLPLSSTTEETPSLSSAAPTSSTSSTTSYTGLENTLDTSSPEYRSLPNDNRLARSFSRGENNPNQRLLALSNECATDIYGYSSEKSKGRDDSGCSATLMSGLSYTRVQHSDPPNNVFPCGLLPDNLQEYHHRSVVGNVHRPPVSPLRNQGAY